MKTTTERPVLEISKYKLDEDCGDNPKLTHKWCKRLADAKRDAKIAKGKFDLIAAQMNIAIRMNPEGFQLPKVTDEVVKAAVIVQPGYQQAQEAYFQAEHDRDTISAMVEAVHDKREELTNMVKLHGQDYFSTVPVDPKSKERIDEKKRIKGMPKVKR